MEITAAARVLRAPVTEGLALDSLCWGSVQLTEGEPCFVCLLPACCEGSGPRLPSSSPCAVGCSQTHHHSPRRRHKPRSSPQAVVAVTDRSPAATRVLPSPLPRHAGLVAAGELRSRVSLNSAALPVNPRHPRVCRRGGHHHRRSLTRNGAARVPCPRAQPACRHPRRSGLRTRAPACPAFRQRHSPAGSDKR